MEQIQRKWNEVPGKRKWGRRENELRLYFQLVTTVSSWGSAEMASGSSVGDTLG